MTERKNCFEAYAKGDEELLCYHDEWWGRPCHDEAYLAEMLLLESFQAGLSWQLIYHRREAFRQAFDGFDMDKIAAYTAKDVERIMQAPLVIHNRRKIEGAVANARAVLKIRQEFGSFSAYLWHFTEDHTIIEPIRVTRDELSDEVSRDMRRRGMKFVGSVTIFSYLQSVGIIYSHPKTCWRYEADGAERFEGNRYEGGRLITGTACASGNK